MWRCSTILLSKKTLRKYFSSESVHQQNVLLADVQLGKGVHRQLISVLPAIIAKNLLIPVGMLAKTGSRKLPIVHPAVQVLRKSHLDVVLGPVKAVV